jgi:hypothetical protein
MSVAGAPSRLSQPSPKGFFRNQRSVVGHVAKSQQATELNHQNADVDERL